jgi:hypothetical protein
MTAQVPRDKPHETEVRQLRIERHSEDQRLTVLTIRLRDGIAQKQFCAPFFICCLRRGGSTVGLRSRCLGDGPGLALGEAPRLPAQGQSPRYRPIAF